MDPVTVATLLTSTAAASFGIGLGARFARFAGRSPAVAFDQPGGARFNPFFRRCSILGNNGDALRGTDGSYTRMWLYDLAPTVLSPQRLQDRRCDDLARLLALPHPAGTVVSFRVSIRPDLGEAVDAVRRSRPPAADCNSAARELHDHELDHLLRRAELHPFRAAAGLCLVRVPPHRTGAFHRLSSGFNRFAEAFAKRGFGVLRSELDPFTELTGTDEAAALAHAEEIFRTFQAECPLALTGLPAREAFRILYLGRHPLERDVPRIDPAARLDFRQYLASGSLEFDDRHVVEDGVVPVARVSLTVPPQPTISADVLRPLLLRPDFNFPHTLCAEFIHVGAENSRAHIDARRAAVERTARRIDGSVKYDTDMAVIDRELGNVRADLTRPGNTLVKARFHVLVQGPPLDGDSDAVEILRERCRLVQSAVRQMPGADAVVEQRPFLKQFFTRSVVGEADNKVQDREITEISDSLACLVPTEFPWKGNRHPHFILPTAPGRLLGLDFLDAETAGPVVPVLGIPGSGKTFLFCEILLSFLASFAKARAVGLDFGRGAGSLVELLGGLRVRFDPTKPRAVNIWAYDGMEREAPDEAQIELVVSFYLLLSGLQATDDQYKYARAVLGVAVPQCYKSELARLAHHPEHEPTLGNLLAALTNFPWEQALRPAAGLLHGLLKQYEASPWLNRPTAAEYRSAALAVYELDSLEAFPKPVQTAVAYTVASRVVRSLGALNPDGTRAPVVLWMDEMWKAREQYPAILDAANTGARIGRASNAKLFLLTHDYRDLSGLAGILQAAAVRIVGAYQGDFQALGDGLFLTDEGVAAVRHIRNQAGRLHQFLVSSGYGDDQRVELCHYTPTPLGRWACTTNPTEQNLRTKTIAAHPDKSLRQCLELLADKYPDGFRREDAPSAPAKKGPNP